MDALGKKTDGSKKKKAKKKQRKIYQEKAYTTWTQLKEEDWWVKTRSHAEAPTQEQEAFLKCVIERCNTERRELASQRLRDLRTSNRKKSKTQDNQKLTEALRICLFGIPGAGKSSCLKLLRS